MLYILRIVYIELYRIVGKRILSLETYLGVQGLREVQVTHPCLEAQASREPEQPALLLGA